MMIANIKNGDIKEEFKTREELAKYIDACNYYILRSMINNEDSFKCGEIETYPNEFIPELGKIYRQNFTYSSMYYKPLGFVFAPIHRTTDSNFLNLYCRVICYEFTNDSDRLDIMLCYFPLLGFQRGLQFDVIKKVRKLPKRLDEVKKWI